MLPSFILNFFYPTRCLVCEKAGAWVHSECRAELPYINAPLCNYCGRPVSSENIGRCKAAVCSHPARSLDKVRSVFLHTGGGRAGVIKLKYRSVRSLAEYLGDELTEAARRYSLDKVDGVLPIPLHAQRLRERGYNQAGLIAARLAQQLNLPYLENQLIRRRNTMSQVDLNGDERRVNMQAAFEWRGQPLDGQRLLLIDDVCTTGSTLHSAASVLKAAGASAVYALTLTRQTQSG